MALSMAASGQRSSVAPSRAWRTWHLVGLTCLGAYSTALSWQAQFVSYALYRAVAEEDFLAYHDQYNHSIPGVVIVPGFVTFLAAGTFLWTRPRSIPSGVATVVSGSGVVALLSTVLWAIPRHNQLDRDGQSAAVIDSLLQANAVRTSALTLGTLALAWCTGRLLLRRGER
jgi:hypothetical protein